MDKRPFYLTKRKTAKGKTIYYYYTFDNYGNRTVPKSTGLSNKTDAFNYCLELFHKQSLVKSKYNFKDFAEKVYGENSFWKQEREMNNIQKVGTELTYKSLLNYRIYPYFGSMDISKITTDDIKQFRVHLSEEKLSNSYINLAITLLKYIFNAAIDEDLIYKNPVNKSVVKLRQEHKRVAFTYDEVLELLSVKRKQEKFWVFVLTGALTGMRFSEISGLTVKQIQGNQILVNQQYTFRRIVPVKTESPRFVPCPDRLRDLLLKTAGNCEFVFHPRGKDGPMCRNIIEKEFLAMYSEEMQKARIEKRLTFHSLRYFFNTYLLANNIQTSKVDFIIGHSEGTGTMTALYTTWSIEMYKDVLELQDRLLDDIFSRI